MSFSQKKERRLYARVNRIIPVSIFYDSRLIAFRQTINVSIGGILVNTEDLGLGESMLVEAGFDVNQSKTRNPAVVSWCTVNRLALAFELVDKKIVPLLRCPQHSKEAGSVDME